MPTDFEARVYEVVRKIPRGKVSTYKAIARALGDERKARAVGRALARNPEPIKVPCHRVVRSDLTLGGYSLGLERKRRLLEEEGVVIRKGRVDASCLFEAFSS
jgi:methylated-DNA-[protein]-cysteine S-methyltransferase